MGIQDNLLFYIDRSCRIIEYVVRWIHDRSIEGGCQFPIGLLLSLLYLAWSVLIISDHHFIYHEDYQQVGAGPGVGY